MEQLHLRLQETVALPALNQARILAVRALIPKFQVIVRISCRPDDKGLLLPQVLKVLLQLVKGARIPLQKLSGAGNGTAGNLGFQWWSSICCLPYALMIASYWELLNAIICPPYTSGLLPHPFLNLL